MPRLSTSIARRRAYYPRPIASLPDVLVIDIPAKYAHPSLSMGRFHGIMVETPAEHREIETFLQASRDKLVPPDLLDHRPSTLETPWITIAHYRPPCPDWPYLLLSHWPREYADALPGQHDLLARRSYTIEMFANRCQMEKASAKILGSIGSPDNVKIEMVTPDWSFDPGQALH